MEERNELEVGREAVIRAAQLHDSMAARIAELEDGVRRANAHIEATQGQIIELKKLLDQERSNAEVYRQARDHAYQERADALAWLANIELIVERARDGGGLPPSKRKRNGKAAAVEPLSARELPPLVVDDRAGDADPLAPGGVEMPERD